MWTASLAASLLNSEVPGQAIETGSEVGVSPSSLPAESPQSGFVPQRSLFPSRSHSLWDFLLGSSD